MGEGDAGPLDASAVLEQLRGELVKAESEAQSTGNRVKSLKADLAALEKALQDVDKSVEAYEKARPGLIEQVDELTGYADEMRDKVVRSVGDKKDDVDAAVTWFEQAESAGVEQVRLTGEKQAEAEQAFAERQAEAADAQSAYAAAKDRVRALNESVRSVQSAQADLEAADDKSDTVLMYATFGELERRLRAVELKPVPEYRTELQQRWSELSNAQQEVRAADQARAEATFEAKKARDRLSALRAARVSRIVAYAAANPVPPPAEEKR